MDNKFFKFIKNILKKLGLISKKSPQQSIETSLENEAKKNAIINDINHVAKSPEFNPDFHKDMDKEVYVNTNGVESPDKDAWEASKKDSDTLEAISDVESNFRTDSIENDWAKAWDTTKEDNKIDIPYENISKKNDKNIKDMEFNPWK